MGQDLGYSTVPTGHANEEVDNRWLAKNFAPVRETWDRTNVQVLEGKIPEGLVGGQYIRNGPNPKWEQNGRPYHWFDGDGMLHGVYFAEHGPEYVNRYISTAKMSLERELGGPTLPTIGQTLSTSLVTVFRGVGGGILARFIERKSAGSNTAITYHNRRLLTLLEAESPKHVMAPDLVTIGDYNFQNDALGVKKKNNNPNDPTSSSVHGRKIVTAHPKVCPRTGNMYFFGYNFQGSPYVCYSAADPKGNLFVNTRAVPNCDRPIMMHDMQITDQWAVMLDLPLIFNPQANVKAGKPALAFDASQPARFHLVPRETGGSAKHTFECDALMMFHTAVAYESPSGDEVTLIGCASGDPNLMRKERMEESQPFLTEFKFSISTGTMSQKRLSNIAGEFPIINPQFLASRQIRYVYFSREAADNDGILFDGFVKYDRESGKVTEFRLPKGMYTGEASFAPRVETSAGIAEDDGYLICFAAKNTAAPANSGKLFIINTKTMTTACILEMPHRVPFGFHGFWMNKSAIENQVRNIPVQPFKELSWTEWILAKVIQYLSAG